MRKKIVMFSTILIGIIMLISGCSNKDKGTTYTAENPYVIKNAKVSAKHSRIPVSDGFQGMSGMNVLWHYGWSRIVEKISSESYYWEEEYTDPVTGEEKKTVVAFTCSELMILDYTSHRDEEKGKYKPGEVIKCIERYAYSPDGTLYTTYFAGGKAYSDMFRSGKLVNVEYKLGEFEIINDSPLMKIGHKYFINIQDSDTEPLVVNGVEIPDSYANGAFAKINIVEITQEAFNTAMINYGVDIEYTYEPNKSCERYRYDTNVISCCQLYDEDLENYGYKKVNYYNNYMIYYYFSKYGIPIITGISGIAVGGIMVCIINTRKRKRKEEINDETE